MEPVCLKLSQQGQSWDLRAITDALPHPAISRFVEAFL